MSLSGLILMRVDKQRALKRKERISEKTFVILTLLYGGLGVILGGILFSHKTSKASFQIKILMAFIINIGLSWIIGSRLV